MVRAARRRMIVLLGLICLIAPGKLAADYYDNFDDGQYCQDPNDPNLFDPNLWDIDNPHWEIHNLVGDVFAASAEHGWLRLYVASTWANMFIGAGCDDGDQDPNTSATYFDDSGPHYVMGKVKVADTTCGEVMFLLHANPFTWTTYYADLESDVNALRAVWGNGMDRIRKGRKDFPELDEANGFWVAIQFDGDGDPNNSRLKLTAWNGGKFDWDGVWDRNLHILTTFDPNTCDYWAEGACGVATAQMGDGLVADASFDQLEMRWGAFTNVSHTLSVSVLNDHMGTVIIDPDLLDDCNNIDPNDYLAGIKPTYDDLRRYTAGTEVTLVAMPIEGKAFKNWKVYDPNHPGDANYAVEDTNAVVYLTMDADYEIQAAFTCGSGEMLLPLGMVLMALGVSAALRRLT